MLRIVRAGALTTVQDLGRPGYAHLGVPPSGALDRAALVRANRLVGNDDGAAGLETTLTGVRFRLSADRRFAVTGASAPVTIDGEAFWLPALHPDGPILAPAGATVAVGTARTGLRSYVAIAGGIAVPPVLGSRSTDRLSGLGPAPLRDGDELPLGPDPGREPREVAGHRPYSERLLLHRGPRDDWLTGAAWQALRDAEWTVSRDSDRVGVRLSGPRLAWARTGELPSEGLVTGAVQVPPDGQPVVFLADHPTTGGYPVAGVVDPPDLAALAQARPGSTVRFAVE